MSDQIYDTKAFQQNKKLNEDHLCIARAFFEERGWSCTKPDDISSQTGGVNLRVTDPENRRTNYFRVSVKVDTWVGKTGNLLIEFENKRKNNLGIYQPYQGWFNTLSADKLVIIDVTQQYVYLFDWKKLKAFIKANKDDPKICTVRSDESRCDAKTSTTNLLVRLSILEEKGLRSAKRKEQRNTT